MNEMSFKRILGWLIAPFIMVIIDWKRVGILLKLYGGAWLFIILIGVVAVATADPEELNKKQAVTKAQKTVLYPDSILKSISEINKTTVSKNEKYAQFEQKMIGLKPTKTEMDNHLKIIKSAYNKLTFEAIQTIDDDTLLKQIYSARIVDNYYNFDDPSNPTGLFAFNYIQIAKDAYRDILQLEQYDINKNTMDKHFENM
jgi:hypothetical protein